MKKQNLKLFQQPKSNAGTHFSLSEINPLVVTAVDGKKNKKRNFFLRVLKVIYGLLMDLLELFYPRFCFACDRKMLEHEKVLCTFCLRQLPKTNYHLHPDNPVEKLFWGHCNVYAAAAYYLFIKGGKVQHLVHNFKYKGFTQIGEYIGEVYGKELMKSSRFADADYIVPIPLHRKKLRQRGFNQSEIFGQGLSRSMKAKLEVENLYRKVYTSTQTKKSRWERFINVDSIFALRDKELYKGKHILLVDDVITTGSTMEACIKLIQEIEGAKVSVVAMATAAN